MKKFSFKRVMACALAIVTLSTVFAGCSNAAPAANSQAATGSAATSKAAGPKTKVLFWYLWSGDAVATIDAMGTAAGKKSRWRSDPRSVTQASQLKFRLF